MQPAHQFLSAFALACLSASSFATTTTYTSSASFLARVAPGSYTNTFSGLSDPATAGAVAFAGSGFSYTAAAPTGIYLSGGFLGTSQVNEALTINFSGANVTAIGANFYVTNFSDVFQPVSVTLTLSDGTITNFTPSSMTDYRGFTSTVAITSLVMSAPAGSLYAGLDNLTVGVTAVPEPASWLLMGLGVAGLVVARRRAV